jgi:hypothetical protein
MSQFVGYVCDVCGTISDDRSVWLRLNTIATGTGDKGWDICSNKCLATIARNRAEAAGELLGSSTRTYAKRRSDEEKLEIVLFANEHGASAAFNKYGVAGSTIKGWQTKFEKAS